MLLNARRFYGEGKGTDRILLAIEDITERKKTEEALKISETRYQRLFETAQDGILILDAETGQISDVGKDGAAAILGLHPSTLRARMHKLGIVRPETKESD